MKTRTQIKWAFLSVSFAYQLTNFAKIGSHIQLRHPLSAVPGPEPAIGAS